MEKILNIVARKLNINVSQVKVTYQLLSEGATIPFISRYRKEVTGGLDEEQVKDINDVFSYQSNLLERKEDVTRLIDEKGLLTDDIKARIESCEKLSEVEEIYQPFKNQKKTKATEAIKAGLEPLAKEILANKNKPLNDLAKSYISENVKTVKDALEGAGFIIAEIISNNPQMRNVIKKHTLMTGMLKTSRAKGEDEKQVFDMYYDWESKIKTVKNHWILAIKRAQKLKIITYKIKVEKEDIYKIISRQFNNNHNKETKEFIDEVIVDSYKRLIRPSVEREIISDILDRAEESAIKLFADNLKQLLLRQPVKGKRVLGFDPAFRTGCKLAVVDRYGTFESVDVIYPHPPKPKLQESEKKLLDIVTKNKIDVIAIGNGTASRESESFVANFIEKYKLDVKYLIVDESGASVYSASKEAIKEFPKLQVEQRSAVSIARRLQEPLSELIKIDPKSIGVGQYQHDVNQKQLEHELNFVVESAVNNVGVNVNTASTKLLSYVAGINATIAKKIKEARKKNPFKNREQLKKISSFSDKVFEQSSGFLRIVDGDNPFDKTIIHPESYEAAKKIMAHYDIKLEDIGNDVVKDKLKSVSNNECTKFGIDEYTFKDICDALIRPTHDPRDDLDPVVFKSTITKLEDLNVGDELNGVVRNIVDFGAFIDVGLKNDGLAHISKLTKKFIKHPSEVVKIGQHVTCWVEKIHKEKNKINLTLVK